MTTRSEPYWRRGQQKGAYELLSHGVVAIVVRVSVPQAIDYRTMWAIIGLPGYYTTKRAAQRHAERALLP